MYFARTLFAIVTLLVVASNSIALKGITAGVCIQSGRRPFRQDIEQFQKERRMFTLYILALREFNTADENDLLSGTRVAGIHGWPYKVYDNVTSYAENPTVGYALHQSILFGPWHQAYLAHYEQIIFEYAQKIASKYPDGKRTKYMLAANFLRIPYWDWSRSPELPEIVKRKKIDIDMPEGRRRIDNPLYTFEFKGATDSVSESPTQIVRASDIVNDRCTTRDDLANAAMTNIGKALREDTYRLIASQPNFAAFSNQAYRGPLRNNNPGNMEEIHNRVHAFVAGHMNYIAASSFDPLFFLHHANVDRFYEIWKAIYPDSYVIDQLHQDPTFTYGPNTTETINTPLAPFKRDDNGNFHTAATIRSTKNVGYSYPEIQDWGNITSAQLSLNVKKELNKILNPTGTTHAGSGNRSARKRLGKRNVLEPYNEYLINIVVDKNSLGTSFFNRFFLGEPPANPKDWTTAKNLAASHAVLVQTQQVDGDVIPVVAQLSLTTALEEAKEGGKIENLDLESVKDFLDENLEWRVQKLDGNTVDPASLVDLHITVGYQVVTPNDDLGSFSEYGPFETLKINWSDGNLAR
ncbi:Di-copper centre-containing protein [Patellaria atrata CBS 101060]|uniref:tyrosinase n=1 Tax=Patellaria atrata CBS 101060 TaxID=1346257 RepID=A0A9P4S3D7_9PEZI|nr:Di-copper centre-containing protein [Patellaria atrata CBS 101060]